MVIENNFGTGFMAGYCRNLGILHINNPELILFLDGDCELSTNDIFNISYNELSVKEDSTIILISRFFERKDSHEIEELDRRLIVPWVKGKVFVDGINNQVVDTYVSRWKSLVISCAFGVNMKFVNFVTNINIALNYDGILFPSIFDGNWGGEDEYLGWIAMLFNIRVVAIDPKTHVTHIWHESSYSSKYEKTADVVYETLVEYALDNDAPGSHNILVDLQKIVFESICDIRNKKGPALADPYGLN